MSLLSDAEFSQFQRFIYDAAGISLSAGKKSLVVGRLAKRLKHCGVATYGEYFRLLERKDSQVEQQMAIDLLTTNETYFFREPKHFDFLKQQLRAVQRRSQPFRVWSAAGSTGEEAYSIAMLLEDMLPGRPWEVVGSDISTRVLERARNGHYSTARTEHIPAGYLKRFCRRGLGEQQGTLLIDRKLRERVQFIQVNLNAPLPDIGKFDVVFLRNVLIYFDTDTKRAVVERVATNLRSGGWLLIGHSESLCGVTDSLTSIAPAIFQKPG
jgi:chemotaxis protein methyltransferase CheR